MLLSTTQEPPAKRKPYLAALIAFAAGIGVTIPVMVRLRMPTPPVPVAATEHHDEEHTESGIVKLTPEAERAAGIGVARPITSSERSALSFPATVEVSAERVAKITPPVAGKVVRLFVKPGDAVRAGQPVAIVDSYEIAQAHAAERDAQAAIPEAEAALATAHAAVFQALTTLENARTTYQTQRELAQTGIYGRTPVQAAQTDLAEAEAALLSAEQELETDAMQLERTERLYAKGILSRNAQEQARLEVKQDDARVAAARARVNAAKETLRRESEIAQSGLRDKQAVQGANAEVRAAESAVTRARREEQVAKTRLSAARATLASVQANLESLEGSSGHIANNSSQITIDAPMAGVVSATMATRGETVERSTSLLELDNLSTVTVLAQVPEQEVARVKAGQPARITVAAYPGRTFNGVVESLSSRLSEKTRTLGVRCIVPNASGLLRPEMFAKVSLAVGASHPALTVPLDAVVTEREDGAETSVVFVRRAEPGHYEKRIVTPGGRFADRIAITKGVRSDESVVTRGAYTLLSETKKGELSEEGHSH